MYNKTTSKSETSQRVSTKQMRVIKKKKKSLAKVLLE